MKRKIYLDNETRATLVQAFNTHKLAGNWTLRYVTAAKRLGILEDVNKVNYIC
jgi:hypothetical protein